MEIRCSRCGHIGPAAQIRPSGQSLELVCASCGHANVLSLGPASQTSDAALSGPASPQQRPASDLASDLAPDLTADLGQGLRPGQDQAAGSWAKPAPSPRDARAASASAALTLTPAFVERLVPTPGDGLRCPKCAHLVRADDANCARCGLNLAEAARYPQGQAPWDQPPAERASAWERAELLWASAQECWEQEHLDKFMAVIKDEGLHELGVRRLRFALVDRPQDPLALAALHDLATQMQARVLVAREQSALDKQVFEHEVTKLRTLLMVGSLLFWGAILLMFGALFMKNCG